MTDREKKTDLDALLEAEIQAALGDMSVEDMLDYQDAAPRRQDASHGARQASRGAERGRSGEERDFRTGTVVGIHGDDVFVEFGPKMQGICPVLQFKDGLPAIGARLDFVVDRVNEEEGLLILSREGAVRKAEWEALDVGQVVEARCTGTNKGGLEMELANHKAFMPAGQVDLRHVPDLSVFIGEKMPCEIMEIDRRRGRIVLSRKMPLESDRRRKREQLLGTLAVGQSMQAVITSVQPFGAFADIGGVDGLIHVSDLSYQRVQHPSEVVKVGDQVRVKVLKVDLEQEPPRIGLGLKQTLEDPYAAELDKIEVGALVGGRVTKLMPFGAFVELSPGVEGLIHISELSAERVQHPGKVVKLEEVVSVKVLSIDPDQRRISLSLKQARSGGDGDAAERPEDHEMRKLKAQLSQKFGDLKGGLG